MIGPVEILAIGATFLVPALIIFLIIKGGMMLADMQKEIRKISEKLDDKEPGDRSA